MTDAKFNEIVAIKQKIEKYDDMLKKLNDDQYDHFIIKGMCCDGVGDYIDLISDGCLKVIKQWYIDEWIKAKEEFEKI